MLHGKSHQLRGQWTCYMVKFATQVSVSWREMFIDPRIPWREILLYINYSHVDDLGLSFLVEGRGLLFVYNSCSLLLLKYLIISGMVSFLIALQVYTVCYSIYLQYLWVSYTYLISDFNVRPITCMGIRGSGFNVSRWTFSSNIYVERRAMTAPTVLQISAVIAKRSCDFLYFVLNTLQGMVSHIGDTFYRNVINNNKTTPNKQASIIGSNEWNDDIWICVGLNIFYFVTNRASPIQRRWKSAYIQ